MSDAGAGTPTDAGRARGRPQVTARSGSRSSRSSRPRPASPGRSPFVRDLLSLGRREGLSGGLMLLAAPLLLIALLLPWSDQFSAATLARYGSTPALSGIPHSLDGWQAYSIADILLALLALALAWVALRRRPASRWVLLGCLAVALAFCAHASGTPPTDGATLWDASAHRYVDTGATSGAGEALALVALALGTAGTLLSLLASARRA